MKSVLALIFVFLLLTLSMTTLVGCHVTPSGPDDPDTPDTPDLTDDPSSTTDPTLPDPSDDPSNPPSTPLLEQSVAVYVTNEHLTYIDALCTALKKEIKTVDLKTQLDDPLAIFDTERYDAVIVAGVDSMATSSKRAIEGYMNHGGRLVTLGGPAFETTLYSLNGELLEREEYLLHVIEQTPDEDKFMLVDMASRAIVDRFTRSTGGSMDGDVLEIGNYGLKGSSRQLYHEVQSLSNWNTIAYNVQTGYPLNDANAIMFYAKAMDDHTGSLYVEITDANGSRWSAAPTLDEEWGLKILCPLDFTWWHDSPAPKSDFPSFDGLKRISIGFARTGQAISEGHHSYCISDISLVASDDINLDETDLTVDSLSPLYELYPITNGSTLVTSHNQVFISDRNYTLSDETVSCFPGRQGLGFANDRTSRFIPLIEVKDAKGLHSGYAAWMYLFSSKNGNANGAMEGSILSCFSSVSEEFYDKNGIAAVVETVKAMMQPAFLLEGGTNEFIYVTEDTNSITAGLIYVDLNEQKTSDLTAAVTLYKGDVILGEFSSQAINAMQVNDRVSWLYGSYDVSKEKPDRAVATLTWKGEVIDRIEHTVKFWEPTPKEERHFVYIEDGQFKKNGEIISFFGVNYMPSYGIAEPNKDLFEYYVSAASYDPDVIANDLAHIKDIGMNSVAIFVNYEAMKHCNNILDLIDQCQELGLYVNLSIRPHAYPLRNYNEAQVETMIRRLHFHENETVYAYDIAWEERIGSYTGDRDRVGDSRYIGRDHWDDEWAKWIDLQYGSLSHAEQLWGVKLEKTKQGYPYVSDAMLDDQTGKYTKVTAAYYRFIDDQVAKLMNEKMLHMQPLAPDQLITFRMSMSGSGLRDASNAKPSTFCFDFQSLASTMAYMEPEGYRLGANDEQALQIAIANAYARYVQPDSPVVWKEFGQSVWDKSDDCNFDPDDDVIASVASYYEYSLEYMLKSYTSGVYAWYYAGGYRINENSDYGILNPDGSDRGEITALLREYAPKFINQGARPEADILITVERDGQDGGIFGIYEATAKAARAAYDNGQFFDFVNATTKDTDDVVYADEVFTAAVGGTAEEGLYPLRYVNGMIKSVEHNKDGTASITVCNTAQSVWRAGTVSVVANGEIVATVDEEVDYLANVTLTVPLPADCTLRLCIEGRAFGMSYQP